MTLDPSARCPASGLTNAACQASICDCFPEEDDRFGIHPEYFIVGGVELEWGVMFSDGSVSHPWNGHTQRQRAEEELARLQEQYKAHADHWSIKGITLAYRRGRDGTWTRLEQKAGTPW